MEESPTGGSVETTGANTSPTGQGLQTNPADVTNQETISQEQSQETVSDDTAKNTQTQTNQNGGDSTTDDGLAKFAKSQGFDPENLTDGERRALKIAHDNQKAYRQSTDTGKKVTDTAKELGGTDVDARIAQLEYQQETDRFWSSQERDRSLEPAMVEILNEKAEKHGKEYAFTLSRDLDTLYQLAQLKNGAAPGAPVDAEAIRREERDSIRKQSAASAGQPHAVSQTQTAEKIDRQWLETKYDPSNPEHRKAVDAALAAGDLY